jgi:hypothetical protein
MRGDGVRRLADEGAEGGRVGPVLELFEDGAALPLDVAYEAPRLLEVVCPALALA